MESVTLEQVLTQFFNDKKCRYVCIYEVGPGEETHLVSNVSGIAVETVLENILRDFQEGNFIKGTKDFVFK